ncbi:hypothetical protein AI29_10015, partial [bacteria symbiont BFo2 of Frankliniella occidentalis]
MMNYQEMSDSQINLEVAKALGLDVSMMLSLLNARECPIGGRAEQWVKNNKTGGSFDPCNSWADAGPIIQENRISLFASDDEGKWMAQFINYKTVHMDKNPLRAAMIVFLMMKG